MLYEELKPEAAAISNSTRSGTRPRLRVGDGANRAGRELHVCMAAVCRPRVGARGGPLPLSRLAGTTAAHDSDASRPRTADLLAGGDLWCDGRGHTRGGCPACADARAPGAATRSGGGRITIVQCTREHRSEGSLFDHWPASPSGDRRATKSH